MSLALARSRRRRHPDDRIEAEEAEPLPSAPRTGTIFPLRRGREDRRFNGVRPTNLSLVPLSKNPDSPQTSRIGWTDLARDDRTGLCRAM